jgi:redox-sensitive bicupin YhaK (pirin superfamily)
MLEIRKSKDRGHAHHGWLDTYHTFSFASYYDPQFMGFKSLRVINEDRIAGGAGFSQHGHRDMEIITIILEGELKHKDTLGTSTVIRPGEVQRMTAGTGIEHSEFNHLENSQTHLLQIWILPDQPGRLPSYEQKDFSLKLSQKEFVLIASPDGREGSLTIHQDLSLYQGLARTHKPQVLPVRPGRSYWLQMLRGSAQVNALLLVAGDGLAIQNESVVQLISDSSAEYLLFDMADN